MTRYDCESFESHDRIKSSDHNGATNHSEKEDNEFKLKTEEAITHYREKEIIEEAFKNIRKVYHCAALISFDPNDFKRLVEVNEEGTGNIVNLSISHKIDKLCYVSSIAALGKDPNSPEVTEQSEWRGTDVNPYALTKYLAEMEVWRGSQEGISTVIVNPGVILGPGFWESGSGRLSAVQQSMNPKKYGKASIPWRPPSTR